MKLQVQVQHDQYVKGYFDRTLHEDVVVQVDPLNETVAQACALMCDARRFRMPIVKYQDDIIYKWSWERDLLI